MIETILSIYFGGCLIMFGLLVKFAGNKSSAGDLFAGAFLWPATLLFGMKEWISK